MNSIDEDGNVLYRGFTLVVSDIQVHIWQGGKFITQTHGEPHVALKRAKEACDRLLQNTVVTGA